MFRSQRNLDLNLTVYKFLKSYHAIRKITNLYFYEEGKLSGDKRLSYQWLCETSKYVVPPCKPILDFFLSERNLE
jgi:hypothetical protein